MGGEGAGVIHDPHVGLGHVLIAIAEPHGDGLGAYHSWFERDHRYSAVLIGPGAFAAERYLATRELKALRYPADGGAFASVEVGALVARFIPTARGIRAHLDELW